MMRSVVVVTVLVALLCAGCPPREPERTVIGGPPEGEAAPAGETEAAPVAEMQITSTAFEDGGRIPEKYTADGADVSPPLSFAGVPDEAAELVLICHDPDAPRAGGWTHWVVYGMSPDIGGLPEALPPDPVVSAYGLTQGDNSWGKTGYGGPDPPEGKPHRYQFKLYAVRPSLSLQPGAARDEVEAAMADTVVAEAMLEGLYGR